MDFSLNGISITPCNESFDIGPPRFGIFSSVSEYITYRQIFPDCF